MRRRSRREKLLDGGDFDARDDVRGHHQHQRRAQRLLALPLDLLRGNAGMAARRLAANTSPSCWRPSPRIEMEPPGPQAAVIGSAQCRGDDPQQRRVIGRRLAKLSRAYAGNKRFVGIHAPAPAFSI